MTDHLPLEWISGYLDGQVSAAERQQVEAHLETCPACRERLEGLRHAAARVRGLAPVAAPAALRTAVRSLLAQNRARAPALARLWPFSWTPARPTWRTGLAAAVVLLVGLFSLNLLQQFGLDGRVSREGVTDRGASPVQTVDPGGERPSFGLQRVGVPGGALPQAQAPLAPRLPFDRQVIRTADLHVEVAAFEEASDALLKIAESAGGFLADSRVTQGEPPRGTFVLRVPAPRFAEVLDRVGALGKVTVRQVSGQDVTEEFIDLQARIRNLQTHEGQLLTFMGRATRVSDLLAIEQELSRVRGEIEQLTGRLRYLGNRVEMATVQVTLREKAKQGSTLFWDFPASLRKVQAAFLGTVRYLLGAGERLLILASALVPLALLAGAGWGVLRWVHRRGARAV